MKRMITLAALVIAALAARAGAATPKLTALVADPVKISLTEGGRKVTRLQPGAYTLVVRDTAPDHDFHLRGPGVDRATSVAGRGTYTWKVKLKKGTYTFVCDPHSSFMKGSFTVS
jgi:plastocyanin